MRIVRISELTEMLAISKTSLWRLRQSEDFPTPIQLGPRIIAWKISDIESWLENK